MIPSVLLDWVDDGTFVKDAKPPMKLLCLQYPCIVTLSSPNSKVASFQAENVVPRIVSLSSPSIGVASAVDLRVAPAVDLSVATPPPATLKTAPNLANRHWCHFPPSQFLNKANQITAEDFSSTIAGLTLCNWLVPLAVTV